jgi:hypothetical protein
MWEPGHCASATAALPCMCTAQALGYAILAGACITKLPQVAGEGRRSLHLLVATAAEGAASSVLRCQPCHACFAQDALSAPPADPPHPALWQRGGPEHGDV